MKFEETRRRSVEILKAALPDLNKNDLPINPYNYGLWYALLSEQNEALRKELEALLKERGVLTHEQSIELYKKHVINDLLIMDEGLQDGYTSTMSKIKRSANRTGETAKELNDELATTLSGIDDIESSAELKSVVKSVAEKTLKVSKATEEFQDVITEAQKEIDRLKEELKEAKEAADIDPLTKLNNRRHFDEKLLHALSIRNTDRKVGVIMVDVDHFKSFNDTYGHLVGDEVLKELANALRKCCKNTSVTPCRFGGEEFSVVLSRTTLRSARMLAENIRKHISMLLVRDPKTGRNVPQITASLGLAFAEESDTIESLVERADRALYRAKENGRNHVVVF
jgi:diguanylate cyclase